MTPTKYTYIKRIYMSKLIDEINAASLSVALQHVDLNDNQDGTWTTDIWFVDVLSEGNVTTLDSVVSAHVNAPPTTDSIRARIIAARQFGQTVIDEVAMDNILAGVTTSQIISILSKYGGIMAMLQSGSLYTALIAMQASTPDDVMTQPRIDKYVRQVKDYLGIP